MLRICLLVVVVAGLGALVVSQVKVAETIRQTKQDLENTQTQLASSRRAEADAKNSLRTTKAELDQTADELETTKADLEVTTANLKRQQLRADELETELTETTRSKNEAQSRLAEFEAFGRTPQQISDVIAENNQLESDLSATSDENITLARRLRFVTERLRYYEGEITKVQLPAGLKGRVLAVDPKYEFVVLNIGQDDGVLERGEMLVNRSGKLVAKVQILSVQQSQSVANILPDWKQAEVMEGDEVIVGL